MNKLAVVIPTRDRPDSVRSSIQSVFRQTKLPDTILVVVDADDDSKERVEKICKDASSHCPVRFVLNNRTWNLSGAINSGLEALFQFDFIPERTYVAFLDDDDEWDSEYLQTCFSEGILNNSDWVYTGITRYSEPNKSGIDLSIPSELTVDDFLISNPHIQGSNLFVRLSTLLQAGGFDESLSSTTDRDVCIRLLDLGETKIHRINKHLVHHYAYTNSVRLSSPGSEKKKQGLETFYIKYAPRMTTDQRRLFKMRALDLFQIQIEFPEAQSLSTIVSDAGKNGEKQRDLHIIIGIIVTRIDSAQLLLDDLVRIQSEIPMIGRILLLDNCNDTSELINLVSNKEYRVFDIIIQEKTVLERDAKDGVFGGYLKNGNHFQSIAGGRTALHHYVYQEIMKIPNAIAWIIDDDIRIDYLSFDRKKNSVKASDILCEIINLKNQGVSIGVLQITGNPPIPGMSILRTQLVDILHNLKREENDDWKQVSFLDTLSWMKLTELSEFFYDYSNQHYAHLEFPVWYHFEESDSFTGLLQGNILTRPSVRLENRQSSQCFVPVGGSYFVLNPECLRDFPVLSPTLCDVNSRRGDTFWGILNSRIRGRIVKRCNVAIRQERVYEHTYISSIDQFHSDIIGSSFVRAIDAYYEEQERDFGSFPARLKLTIPQKDIEEISESFVSFLNNRLSQFILTSYRIIGLLLSLKQTKAYKNNQNNLAEFVSSLEGVFSRCNIQQFIKNIKGSPWTDLADFLTNLKSNVKDFRKEIDTFAPSDAFTDYSKIVMNEITTNPLEYLGEGKEAVVWSDGTSAYKHFRYGWSSFEKEHREFIKRKLLGKSISVHLARLEEVVELDGDLVFKIELINGSEYNGGFASDITQLLIDCKNSGIAISNFHPHNLIISKQNLVFCDIGRSIIPFNERELLPMSKRAFLTFRYHFREDLDELMAHSLYNDTLPELFGFEYLLRSINLSTKNEVLDPYIIKLVQSSKPSQVFDYGCGKGVISEELAEDELEIVGFDIDSHLIERNKSKVSDVRYIDNDELKVILETNKGFDVVICSLVLCTIDNDDITEEIMANIRKLVNDNGKVVLSICNPFYSSVIESDTHQKKMPRKELEYHLKKIYEKYIKETNRLRRDVHRPFDWYKQLFLRCGFQICNLIETENVDTTQLLPSSDFLIFELSPLPLSSNRQVSLLIKASPIEWETIDFQIKHIVGQLEGPQRFCEKIVVTDRHAGSFLRQYSKPNHDEFFRKLNELQQSGIIDRIVYAPISDTEIIERIYQKWFDITTTETHAKNGQHTFTSLFGLDECTGDYILQLDSDCIIYRGDRSHDYLSEMISVLETDSSAITVSFNIAQELDIPFTHSSDKGNWRVEVRCGLFDRKRMLSVLPLQNSLTVDNLLEKPWHRALDERISNSELKSYRGGSKHTSFIHVPNERKSDYTEWYNIIKAVERGILIEKQIGYVDLNGNLQDWLGSQNTDYIFLIRGKDVPISKLRRCIDSMINQDYSNWGVILIDAGSQNGMSEYIEEIVSNELGDRVTLYMNWVSIPSICNISNTTRNLCSNPHSVIIHLDADDALVNSKVLSTVASQYSNGADATVGSMIRTDKYKDYPVDFSNPRMNRGGNVWQHLRTFRKYLFDSIRIEDFKIDDVWIPIAEDWAFMMPIIEMSENPVHIKDILYYYEPGGSKSEEVRIFREAIIGRIVSKKSYSSSDVIK